MKNTDTFYNMVIQELASKSANKEIEAAEFKARFYEVNERAQKAEACLARVDAVFAANPELKELFDEAEAKMEVDHGLE